MKIFRCALFLFLVLFAVTSISVRADDQCGALTSVAEPTPAQKQARLQRILRPVPSAKRGSFAEVSQLITREQWDELAPAHRQLAARILRAAQQGEPVPAFCFAPGTDLHITQTFDGITAAFSPLRIGGIWSRTATNASVARGQSFTLTWGIAPDGTRVSRDGTTLTSNLQARTRTAFGTSDDSVLIARLQAMFNRYEELTGIRYVHELNDDSAALPNSAGVLGTRPDIRISGTAIDGVSGTLAVNYFPNFGDMIIDTGENDSTYTGDQFRLVLSHEHGHGLGLEHTCPTNRTKMMEPLVSSLFTHAQLDDILGIQRNYGDTNEASAGNDTTATATSLGTRSVGTLSYGQFPTTPMGEPYQYITTQKPVTIDGSNDTDVYRFDVDAVGRTAQVTITPVGESYLEGSQNSNGSCTAGTPLDPKTFAPLQVELVNSAGTIVGQGTATLGQPATIAETGLANTGPYYVRVSEDGTDKQQIYTMALVIGGRASAAPNVTVNVTPKTPRANSTLTGTVTASDPDGTPVTLTYQWFRNDAPITGATNRTLNLSSVGGIVAGDVIRLDVTASDGDPPPAVASDSVTVQEAPSLIVTSLLDTTANDDLTTLREAVTYAGTLAGAQTVSFVSGLSGTISLNSGLPQTNKALTITGQSGIEISGADRVRVNTIGASGALTLTNLVLRNGRAGSDKGGLFILNGGSLSATDCVLRNSSALNFGGAIWAGENSTLSFTRCTISDNNAFNAGALWLEGATASFDTCVLSNNSTDNNGGLAYVTKPSNANGAINLLNCQVNGNSAGGSGGGVFIVGNGATGSARNSTFVSNSSGADGGAWADGNQPTPFANCSFNGNSATNRGGAIYDFFQLRVVNCTFRANVAPNGSCIGVANAATRLQNNIFNANSQSTSLFFGGGIGAYESKGNNIATDNGGGFLTQSSDKINTAPLINGPANNGGFVTTLSVNPNSPAIDGGSDVDAADIDLDDNVSESLSAILVTDARGPNFPRVSGGTIDVGAFEVQVVSNAAPVVNPTINSPTVPGPNDLVITDPRGSDADGDTLTYSFVYRINGTIIAGEADKPNRVDLSKYTVAVGDTFTATFTANDGNVNSAPVTLTRIIAAPPVANPASGTAEAGVRSTIGPITGTDPNGLALRYVLLTQPTSGSAYLAGSASNVQLYYTSAPGFSGADSVTFQVVNAEGRRSAPATISITVAGNRAPTASNGSATVTAGVRQEIPLVANDPDGDALRYRITTQPTKGNVFLAFNTNGGVSLFYTANRNASGADQVQFTVTDPAGATSAPATIRITVQGNSAPVANAASLDAVSGVRASVLLSGSDADGDAIVRYRITTQPTNGSAFLAGSGNNVQLYYTSNAGYVGADSVAFTVTDSTGRTSAPATVSVTVSGASSGQMS